jgi:putative PEP-CTERM system TPR-repeat lipoprotein
MASKSSTIPALTLSIALALAAPVMLSGCNRLSNLTSEEHVQRAKDMQSQGDLKGTLLELKSAVQKDPRNVQARWMLANLSVEMADGASAEDEIKKAMELGLSRTSGKATLVHALLLEGDLDRVLKESTELTPEISKSDRAAILGLRGQALIAQGRYDVAQQALEQALQTDPNSVPALIGMTALHGSLRQYDLARPWAEKALKASPTSADAWMVLGDLDMAQRRLAEAEKDFGNAIKYRGRPYLEQAKRAQVRTQLKKYQDAADDINALKAAGLKDDPLVNYIDGLNLFAQGQYQQAAAAFQASYQANPEFLPNRVYLATTQLRLGNTEQAANLAQKILADAPRSRTAQYLLGSIRISRADYDGAKNILQKALASSPDDPQALEMMARVSLLQGDTTNGLDYSKRLAALEPDSKQVQDLLMMAKLVSGDELSSSIKQAGAQAATSGDVYTRDFLLALQAFRDNKLEEALDRAKALEARYPDKVDPPKLSAAVYLASGQRDQGKTELEKALRLQPNEPSATLSLANIEAIQGHYQRAKTLLQPLLKTQPVNTEAVLLLATAEDHLGDSAAARRVVEDASKSNPDNLILRVRLAQAQLQANHLAQVLDITQGLSEAQYRQQPALLEARGKALLASGDSVSAAPVFATLTKLAPNSAPAYFYYADALARGDNARGARKALEQAIKLNPRYLPARVGEIKVLVQFNELEKARQALTKLKQDFGEPVEVLGIEGWFALGTSDFPTAEQKLAAAFQKQPNSELLLLMTRAQWVQKKQEPALKAMRDWLKTHSTDVPVTMQLAGDYLSMGREADATATYEQVIKISPDHVPALNNLAWLYQDRAPQKAMDYAQRAFLLAPKDPNVLDTVGMLTLKNGDLKRGASLLRDAAERAPGDARIQLHLGSALLRQKRMAEAKGILDKIVAKAPGSPEGKEAKSLLGSYAAVK